jgi:hypothetical protein
LRLRLELELMVEQLGMRTMERRHRAGRRVGVFRVVGGTAERGASIGHREHAGWWWVNCLRVSREEWDVLIEESLLVFR